MTTRFIPIACLAMALVGCAEEHAAPAACYEAPAAQLTSDQLCELMPDACPIATGATPALSEEITVVPSTGMPSGVVSQTAHNNLDIAWHEGRLFFAFRAAPTHFASDQVVLYVVSTTDQKQWVLEASFAMGKDLREPRFLSIGDRLLLYFARLGEIAYTFLPEATMVSEQTAGCQWSSAVNFDPVGRPGFIPWRTRNVDGVGHMIGYVGGENIYEVEGDGIDVYWLTTTDGARFDPAIPGQPIVLTGGSSETDLAMLDDGGLVAISRNESGDELGFGSKICRAEAGQLGDWTCAGDPRKYDSPLVFRHRSDVYLLARRQVANDGHFDLGRDDLRIEDRGIEYQTAYWGTPKRCALWKVDPEALAVNHVLDLPSTGDTCFPGLVQLSSSQYLVYNYSSPLDDPELAWNDGQLGETFIYRVTLTLP